MEATAFDDAQQTAQLLDIALSVVGKLRATQWWRMQPTEMLELGQGLQKLSNELYTAQVNLVGELDSENIGQKFGCTSTAALLRQAFTVSPAEANGRVNAARKVVPRESESAGVRPAVLPALAAAMAAGDVNSEHVKSIVATMAKLPAALPVEDVDFWEQFLVEKAAILDPGPFERVCRSILDKADHDGSLDESTAAAKMEFSFGNRNLRTGLTPVKGQLDDYSVEVIKKAIDALSAPRPCSNAGPADENESVAGSSHNCRGATGSDTVVGADVNDAAANSDDDADAVGTPRGTPDGTGTDADEGATDAGCTSTGTSTGTDAGSDGRDSRSPANRRAHALIQALRGFLDAGAGPTQGGERPHITMVMNWDVVKGVVTDAGYSSGGAISPAQARKFLCDAQIIPAIMGGRSEVLDIGRMSRTFPVGMRRAITLRDGGCIWPGCDRPPGWCDCHHVNFWHRDHGDTCYQFGVLLCPHHHTEIHKDEWVIQMAGDGLPELVPPQWIDPNQKALRNKMHRPMGA